MILCQNLTKKDIEGIGKQIAAAFLAESGAFTVLPVDQAEKLFTVIVDTCYQSGHLYTTSENHEGFCVYWSKRERPGFWIQFKMGIQMLPCFSIQSGSAFLKTQNNWIPIEKRYKNEKDFVELFLLAVRKEYQGKGFFRKIMEEVFFEAEKRNCICILDTDSQTKADKYCHAGMHIVESKKQKSGLTMFALER